MKKSTIWTIAIIMGFSFLALLYLQFSYVEEMVKMKKEQFDESVNRSLYQASHNLEVNETSRYLEKDVKETERRAFQQDSVFSDGLGSIKHSHQFAVAADDGTVYSSFQLKTFEMKPSSIPKAMILKQFGDSIHHEVVNEMVDKVLNEELKKAGIIPVGQLKVTKFNDDKESAVTLTVEVEMDPEIDIKGYADTGITVPQTAVHEEEVQAEFDHLMKMWKW